MYRTRQRSSRERGSLSLSAAVARITSRNSPSDPDELVPGEQRAGSLEEAGSVLIKGTEREKFPFSAASRTELRSLSRHTLAAAHSHAYAPTHPRAMHIMMVVREYI